MTNTDFSQSSNPTPEPSADAGPNCAQATGSTVPFHEADIDEGPRTMVNGKAIALSGRRIVEVWGVKDETGVAVRIYRPTKDGKTAKLVFGLSEDAAYALLSLLHEHLSNSRGQECPATDSAQHAKR